MGTPDHDRLLVVLSDVEMGPGGLVDDCPHAGAIADRLLGYAEAEPNRAIDFVLNGDIFDLLKTPVLGEYPRHVTYAVALEKLSHVAGAHGDFFDRLGQILRTGPKGRRITFIPGNHDLEVCFPEVQAKLRALCDATPEQITFPGMGTSIGEVWIEHGSQGDVLFRVDPDRIFLEYEGEQILNFPWASVGLLEAVLGFHGSLCALERVKPREALFRLLPESQELLLRLARRYWAKDFWKGFFLDRDPLKTVSWEIIKEVFHRFTTRDADVSFGSYYQERLQADPRHRVYVVGHQHRSKVVHYGEKVLLQTGCLRNEYGLDQATGKLFAGAKSFVELRLAGARVVDFKHVPFVAPDPPPGYVPDDLRSLLPEVRRNLALLDHEANKRSPFDDAA